jgi:hypothetical protein
MEPNPKSQPDCQDTPMALSLVNLWEPDLRLSDSLRQRMEQLELNVSEVCKLYAAHLQSHGDTTATPGRVRRTIQRILDGEGVNFDTWKTIALSLGGKVQVVWQTKRNIVVTEETTDELD